MTDPTIPTTEAGRKHVLNGWDHDEREQRRALVLAIEAEAAASALSALRAEVAEVARRMEQEFAYLEANPGRVVSAGVAARTFSPMVATLHRIAKAEREAAREWKASALPDTAPEARP